MSRRTIILLWLVFPVCVLVALLYARYEARDLIGTHHPVLMLEAGYITQAPQGRAIREGFRDWADAGHWVLTDASDRYTTQPGNPELHIEVNIDAGSVRFDSFYTKAPARLAYYGDIQSPELQNVIIKSVSGLKAIGVHLKMNHPETLSQLPAPVQQALQAAQ